MDDDERFKQIAGTVAHDVNDVGFLCQYAYRLKRKLKAAEACYADARTTSEQLIIEQEQYNQSVRNLTERAEFASARAATAEAERDTARADLRSANVLYLKLERRATRLEATARALYAYTGAGHYVERFEDFLEAVSPLDAPPAPEA